MSSLCRHRRWWNNFPGSCRRKRCIRRCWVRDSDPRRALLLRRGRSKQKERASRREQCSSVAVFLLRRSGRSIAPAARDTRLQEEIVVNYFHLVLTFQHRSAAIEVSKTYSTRVTPTRGDRRGIRSRLSSIDLFQMTRAELSRCFCGCAPRELATDRLVNRTIARATMLGRSKYHGRGVVVDRVVFTRSPALKGHGRDIPGYA